MNNRVIAIGIDGPNNELFNQWLEDDKLSNMKSLLSEGVRGNFSHIKRYRNERCWSRFLLGRDDDNAGSVFLPREYAFSNHSLQVEGETPLFYALGDKRKVCMFDLPAPMSDDINGIQVSGWSSELNSSIPTSQPANLIEEIHQLFGRDPKLDHTFGVFDQHLNRRASSFKLPSIYDFSALKELKNNLISAIQQRAKICQHLLLKDEWDLFLTAFTESHTANHLLWHMSEDFPVSPTNKEQALLEVYEAIDCSIGKIIDGHSADTNIIIFTLDQTESNSMDVPTMALLPEILYRWCFPDKKAFDFDHTDHLETQENIIDHWKNLLWQKTTPEGKLILESPQFQEESGDPLSWNPANWYKRIWPSMSAFALPNVADGYIRLNVLNREASGIVKEEDFNKTIHDLINLMNTLVNPKTQQPAIKNIYKTRATPFENPDIPADIIICWESEPSMDSIQTQNFGVIGPVPFFRSGGHVSHNTKIDNMFIANGPRIDASFPTQHGNLDDLPATILGLLGLNTQPHQTGRMLLKLID